MAAAIAQIGIPLAISAITSMFSRGPKETKTQKSQSQLIDQLLSSINGKGPYSDLFNVDEAAFQKSYVDPMKQKFQSQIAPQIQQSYISSGMQRGTGMEDQLTRAGVDMDQLLNQQYMEYIQGAQNRKAGAFSSILGAPSGVPAQQEYGQSAMQGATGYLTSDTFGKQLESFLKPKTDFQGQNSLMDTYMPQRKGYENEPQYYDPYSGVMQ